MAERDSPVIVLLASPWAGLTRSSGRHRHAALREGHRRYKASELELRNSDVQFIQEACAPLLEHPVQKTKLESWVRTGTWPSEVQCTVGALLLSKPTGFRHLGQLQDRETFALWHSWGCPAPHLQQPQWLLFQVLDSVCFTETLDHQACVCFAKQAEQRSAWTVRLPMAQVEKLHSTRCSNGKICEEVFVEWGMENPQQEFTVFTTLSPLVFLTARKRWRVLADIARCTPKQLRNPQGLGVNFCS